MRKAQTKYTAADLEAHLERTPSPSGSTMLTRLPSAQPASRPRPHTREELEAIFETKSRPETAEDKRRRQLVELWVQRRNGDTHLRDPRYMAAIRNNEPDLLMAISPRTTEPSMWYEAPNGAGRRRRLLR